MDDLEVLDSYIKTPGGVEKQKKKCGKANCRCAKGTHLHRAYCYRYWRFENGKYIRKRKYLDKKMYIRIGKALARYKTRFPNTAYEIHRNRTGFVDCFRVGLKPEAVNMHLTPFVPMKRFLR